jgi:glycosyltransferase involved in cell wall biosynthesis
MKIAFYYPPQNIVEKDLIFLDYLPEITVSHNKCDETCDLIYVSTLTKLPEAIRAKEQFNKPLVCWVWDLPFNSQTDWDLIPEGLKENSSRPQSCLDRVVLLRKCDKLISASKWTQQTIKNNYGLDSDQIYFYINPQEFDDVPNQPKTNRISQISRYAWNKKWENTLYAGKDLNYELSLIGIKHTPLYYNYINQQLTPNAKLYENIPRTETIKLLKSSKILVSPSVFEGWGISPIEALYCDTAVLLSDLPVFQEVYEDTVLYHDRFDKEDMKEKLKILTQDKVLQNKIINQGKLKIQDFTPKRFAKQFKQLIL